MKEFITYIVRVDGSQVFALEDPEEVEDITAVLVDLRRRFGTIAEIEIKLLGDDWQR